MADLSLRPVPYHPLTILTPPLYQQPNGETLKLIRAAVARIIGDETVYSVTFSPIVCPADKRSLFVFRPFFWQRENGKWGTCPSCRASSKIERFEAHWQTTETGSTTLVSCTCNLVTYKAADLQSHTFPRASSSSNS